MVKITTFNNRPVRHVRYMPDGTVILRLYERRSDGRARHLRVSLPQWWAAAESFCWTATPYGGPRLESSRAAADDAENRGANVSIIHRE